MLRSPGRTQAGEAAMDCSRVAEGVIQAGLVEKLDDGSEWSHHVVEILVDCPSKQHSDSRGEASSVRGLLVRSPVNKLPHDPETLPQ